MKYIQNPEDKQAINCLDTMYPSSITAFKKSNSLFTIGSTFYGYVLSGIVTIKTIKNSTHLGLTIGSGGFFAFPDSVNFEIKNDGVLIVIERLGLRSMPAVGIRESHGRLAYIDGCSDSILVHPSRSGDAVLNHLHFPKGILQTQHTHPSIRLGIVAEGHGHAWQKKLAFTDGWKIELNAGGIFCLQESELHSFMTTDCSMDIIAFHPDSEDGPTDSKHPMISRTYINHGGGNISDKNQIPTF